MLVVEDVFPFPELRWSRLLLMETEVPVSRRAFSGSNSCFYEEKRMFQPLNRTKNEVMQVT